MWIHEVSDEDPNDPLVDEPKTRLAEPGEPIVDKATGPLKGAHKTGLGVCVDNLRAEPF